MKPKLFLCISLFLAIIALVSFSYKEGFDNINFTLPLPNPNLVKNIGGPVWEQFVVNKTLLPPSVFFGNQIQVGTTSPITITPRDAGTYAANVAYRLGDIVTFNNLQYMCLAWTDARGPGYSGTYNANPDVDKNAWAKIAVSPNPNLIFNVGGPAWGQFVVNKTLLPASIIYGVPIQAGTTSPITITPRDSGTYAANVAYGLGNVVTFNNLQYMCLAWTDARGPGYSATYNANPDVDKNAWAKIVVVPNSNLILNVGGPAWGQFVVNKVLLPSSVTFGKQIQVGTSSPITITPKDSGTYAGNVPYGLGNVVTFNNLKYMCLAWTDARGPGYSGTYNASPTADTNAWAEVTVVAPPTPAVPTLAAATPAVPKPAAATPAAATPAAPIPAAPIPAAATPAAPIPAVPTPAVPTPAVPTPAAATPAAATPAAATSAAPTSAARSTTAAATPAAATSAAPTSAAATPAAATSAAVSTPAAATPAAARTTTTPTNAQSKELEAKLKQMLDERSQTLPTGDIKNAMMKIVKERQGTLSTIDYDTILQSLINARTLNPSSDLKNLVNQQVQSRLGTPTTKSPYSSADTSLFNLSKQFDTINNGMQQAGLPGTSLTIPSTTSSQINPSIRTTPISNPLTSILPGLDKTNIHVSKDYSHEGREPWYKKKRSYHYSFDPENNPDTDC